MHSSSEWGKPFRIYIGPALGDRRSQVLAGRVVRAWVEFYRISAQCFVSPRALPLQDAYKQLLESSLYVGLASPDELSFRTEWNLVNSLGVPAFGFLRGGADPPMHPIPRQVQTEAQFIALLACDLYLFTNHGLSSASHHISPRHIVSAEPASLCTILC